MPQVHSPLHLAAKHYPQQAALYYWAQNQYHSISYQALSQAVCACAQQLTQQGVRLGDRLGCIDNNSLELVILYWACVDTGVIFCPLSPRFPAQQIASLSMQYGLCRSWAQAAYRHLLPSAGLVVNFSARAATAPQPIDHLRPCNVILTSGSSGQPKAAVHCLANHIASAQGAREVIPIAQGDNWLLSLPLFHIGGLAIVNRCALAGAAITLPTAELSLAEQLQQQPLTHLSLVATQLVRLLQQDKQALRHVKALLLGGGAIAPSLLQQLAPLAINAYTSYGMTEMASQITTGLATSKGCSGKLLNGRELTIIDHKILVKGDTLFLGYLTHDGGNNLWRPLDDQGWFDTQDLGYWDKDGDLVISGRADNMFVCGGENVQPEEIEAALKRHPDIIDAIVFPLPDSEFGFLPAAIIKGSISDVAPLDDFVRQYIASFKRPRRYYPWPDIASTSLKVPRKQLIEAALARQARL